MWEYYAKEAGAPEGRAFARAMERSSQLIAEEAANLVDLEQVELAVDVGGGSGTIVHRLIQARTMLRGVVLEAANVASLSTAAAENLGLEDRFSAVVGDFFHEIPDADLLILKWILHDWNDEACLKILGNCRRSLRGGGRILIVEAIPDEIAPSALSCNLDAVMLLAFGGRERTFTE